MTDNMSESEVDKIRKLRATADPEDWPSDAMEPIDNFACLLKSITKIFPIIALSLIFFIGMGTTVVITMNMNAFVSISGTIVLFGFLTLNYLALSYYLSVLSINPGFVRYNWMPPLEEDKKKLQFCKICNGFKVPRSHHCSQCNRCVMKMDHHCPWINGCVGFYNQALFVKFCFFSIMASFISFIITGSIVAPTFWQFYVQQVPLFYLNSTGRWAVLLIILFVLAGAVAIAVSILLKVQVDVIISNKTTVEEYICSKADCFRDEPFVFPYDLGIRRNVTNVLCNGPIARGNGTWYSVIEGCDQFTLTREQIFQKTLKQSLARIHRISHSYGGGYFLSAMSYGPRVFFCQPIGDPRRIVVKAGDLFMIYRYSDDWAYGRRVETSDELTPTTDFRDCTFRFADEKRGWFPTNCIENYQNLSLEYLKMD